MGKNKKIDRHVQYYVPSQVAKQLKTQKILRSRIKRRLSQTSAPKEMKMIKNVQDMKKQRKIKKKEKKKLKMEAKKKENAVQKDRPICQINCTAHTFMIKRRLKKRNQEPIVKLNFCRKKDTPSGYLKLPKIQQPQYLKKLYYSLFLTENENPEQTRYSIPKAKKEESVYDPYPILPQSTYKFCPFCKQNIFNYRQHIESEKHIHNWETDDTLIQVKRRVKQYSKLLKKDFKQYKNLYKQIINNKSIDQSIN